MAVESATTAPATAVVASHRLSGEEAAIGEVTLHPDLDALELAGVGEMPLVGGSSAAHIVHDRPDGSCVLSGPPGWLGEAAAGGDVLAFRWDGAALAVEPVDPAGGAGAGELAAALARAFAAQPAPVAFLTQVIEAALRDQPGLLEDAPEPLGQVLPQAGLEYYEGLVGPPGTDWASLQAAQDRQEQLGDVAATFGLSPAGVEALNLLVSRLSRPDPPAEDDRPAVEDPVAIEAATALASEDGVAPALLASVDQMDEAAPERLERLAGRWLRAARGRQRAAALWVQAGCAERRGDQDRQEQLLGEAVSAHPKYRPALQDSAWYASDRGQAGRAAALLATGGVAAEDPWRRALELFSRPGPNQGPRNDPCKCGSGRKAKNCCLAANGWPIEARLPWLYDKALSFLHRPAQRAAVALVMGGFPQDPFLQDLALFEGGGLPRFLEARGPLLPSDERGLAESWVGSRRRLCEVAEVRVDEGLVLEDLLSGERLEVGERAATHHLRRHRLVFVRVVPDGGGNLQLVGDVMLVPFARHQSLLELLGNQAGAAELARWWTAASRPRRLTNREGEVAVLGRAVFELAAGAEPEKVVAALSEPLEPAGADLVLLGELEDGERVVRGRVRVSGRRIVVEANSAERLEHLLELVEEAAPEVSLVDSVAVPLAPTGPPDHGGGVSSQPVALETEELAEEPAPGERMREYEQRWVDQPIPALAGISPRQAAGDAERRRDLLRLLAEMDSPSGPAGMDAAHLRSLLGLEG